MYKRQTGGTPPAKRHPSRQAYRAMELKRFQHKLDIALTLKPAFWPFDVSLSHGIIFALIEEGENPMDFLEASLTNTWANDQNMADEDFVKSVLTKLNLDTGYVEKAKALDLASLQKSNFEDAVEANVFGVPSYVWGGEVFWGQDRIELLDEAISSGRAAFDGNL